MSKKNWKRVPGNKCERDEYGEDYGRTYFLTDEGEWIFPDCAWRCIYCERCLGCLRQLYFDADYEYRFDCPVSLDGDHHGSDSVEEEEEQEDRDE